MFSDFQEFRRWLLYLFGSLFLFIASSCDLDPQVTLVIPKHFPQPQFPENNQLTESRVELGRKLFFDPNISLDSTVSCKSCHLPGIAFSDFRAISLGIHGRKGKRNAPSLVNAAYLNLVNKDGGVKTLDLQALVPIEDENEMGISIVELSKRLSQDPEYVELSNRAYGKDPDAFVVTRALSSFVRTLISGDSAYDRYINGDSLALNPMQIQGMELFFSERLNCSACHSGPFLTNQQFENNGLYRDYDDLGRALITLDSSDTGKFRVPSLRNVGITPPYMHDGSLENLEEVIDHYANLDPESLPLISDKIPVIDLTLDEKKALLEFLLALTDQEYLP